MAWRNISRGSGFASVQLSQRCVLNFLSCFKVLNGFSVLEVNKSHSNNRIPAVLLSRAPEVNLLIVRGHDGEVHELSSALHAIHLLNGLKLELFALAFLLVIGEDVQAVRGEDARLSLPELEEIVASLLKLSFLQDLGNIWARHVGFVLGKARMRVSEGFV